MVEQCKARYWGSRTFVCTIRGHHGHRECPRGHVEVEKWADKIAKGWCFCSSYSPIVGLIENMMDHVITEMGATQPWTRNHHWASQQLSSQGLRHVHPEAASHHPSSAIGQDGQSFLPLWREHFTSWSWGWQVSPWWLGFPTLGEQDRFPLLEKALY